MPFNFDQPLTPFDRREAFASSMKLRAFVDQRTTLLRGIAESAHRDEALDTLLETIAEKIRAGMRPEATRAQVEECGFYILAEFGLLVAMQAALDAREITTPDSP